MEGTEMKSYKLPFYWRIRKFFGANVVALQDEDGEVTITQSFLTPFGLKRAYRHKYTQVSVELLEDGTTKGLRYVVGWKEL